MGRIYFIQKKKFNLSVLFYLDVIIFIIIFIYIYTRISYELSVIWQNCFDLKLDKYQVDSFSPEWTLWVLVRLLLSIIWIQTNSFTSVDLYHNLTCLRNVRCYFRCCRICRGSSNIFQKESAVYNRITIRRGWFMKISILCINNIRWCWHKTKQKPLRW